MEMIIVILICVAVLYVVRHYIDNGIHKGMDKIEHARIDQKNSEGPVERIELAKIYENMKKAGGK